MPCTDFVSAETAGAGSAAAGSGTAAAAASTRGRTAPSMRLRMVGPRFWKWVECAGKRFTGRRKILCRTGGVVEALSPGRRKGETEQSNLMGGPPGRHLL
ncbi:hypothetical protein GCM10017567_09240 [Amycolatopsis bullii]|uniref:Uncharacterized protein n=1 Tax=Amycolatopsis bullii TaxID=941987 RepID=A0ABQ3JZR5_9PSEU|nr:hypothetical protein GCM10017567_09240 [Amycolatopsis bullii]